MNALDLQTNDTVDCGEGDFDVAGIDGPFFGDDADEVAPNCEELYVGILTCSCGPATAKVRGGADLSAIDTRKEAEQAEADGLLRQIR